MKKVKIMLLSLSLVAVVGGALAFKSTYNRTFCTAPTSVDGSQACVNVTCPNKVSGSTFVDGEGDFICTTQTGGNIEDPCPNTLNCDAAASVQIKGD